MKPLPALILAATIIITPLAFVGCATKCPCPTTQPAAAGDAKPTEPKQAGDPADDEDADTGAGAGKTKEPQKTLYDRLGGEATIAAVVDDLLARAMADPNVNFIRQGTTRPWQATPENLALLKKRLIQFLGTATGGPQRYEGEDLRTAHRGMRITAQQFKAFAKDLGASLDAAGVREKERKELLEIIESGRGAIVEAR
jgi:truncated hemoglobin YjbI